MVIMDKYYFQDRLTHLWKNVDKLHLSFLESEESPEKMEIRNKLEGCIKDFLCIASNEHKYCLGQTIQVLYRSAATKTDFSAYKASTGWNSIQQYAGNLLSQPWRKEYRQIKIYSGFYKHQVEANLVGAEIMFEAMGYKHSDVGVLVLEGPICPDQVINVSRDCLIAYVECQIMRTIWEEISSISSITWLDILEFRKMNLCSPEEAVKALKYQFQKQFLDHNQHSRSYSHGNAQCASPGYQMQQDPMTQSFPPFSSHNHLPLNNAQAHNVPQYYYGSNGYSNNYVPYPQMGHSLPVSYPPQPIMKPHFNTNGYYYTTNGYIPQVSGNYPVPTGQLIELESQNNGYDVVDRPTYSRTHRVHDEYEHRINDHSNRDKETELQPENWEYVYRTLEDQGYSKDLGDRGDVLSPENRDKIRTPKKVRSTNLDEVLQSMKLPAEKAGKPISEKKVKQISEKKVSPASSYENVPDEANKRRSTSKLSVNNQPKSTKTVLRDKPLSTAGSSKTKTIESGKGKEESKGGAKWECKACTYLNSSDKDICEMCSKTKTNVEKPMEVGGSQCGNCTLINPKEAKTCRACSKSLANSPTYI